MDDGLPKEVSAADFREQRRDHEPFLQAILNDPDSLEAYLIYADWLTEQNDPLGEFIQVQIQLEDPQLEPRDKPHLRARASDLQSGNYRDWLGDLRSVVDKIGYDFRRGFLSTINMRADKGVCEKLIGSSHVRFLCRIGLWDVPGSTRTEECLEVLARASFDNLRSIGLGRSARTFDKDTDASGTETNLGDITPVLLRMPRLEELELMEVGCDFTKLASLPMKHLTSLILNSQQLTTQTERFLDRDLEFV